MSYPQTAFLEITKDEFLKYGMVQKYEWYVTSLEGRRQDADMKIWIRSPVRFMEEVFGPDNRDTTGVFQFMLNYVDNCSLGGMSFVWVSETEISWTMWNAPREGEIMKPIMFGAFIGREREGMSELEWSSHS